MAELETFLRLVYEEMPAPLQKAIAQFNKQQFPDLRLWLSFGR